MRSDIASRTVRTVAAGEAISRLSALALTRIRPKLNGLILPDACCDLVWAGNRLIFLGPMSVARRTAYPGEDILMLRLDPLVAGAWLNVPLRHLTDRRVPLEEIDRNAARELSLLREYDLLGSLVRPADGGGFDGMDRRLRYAAIALKRGVSVRRVADGVNLCERQLERLFAGTMGLSPKKFAQITRFRRAVVTAKRGDSLSAAALRHGYADQAHFTRDAKAKTGLTPRALLPDVGNIQDVGMDVL